MTKIILYLTALLLLTSCAGQQLAPLPMPFAKPTDTVSFDRVEVALTLGDIQSLVVLLNAKAQAHCRDKSFSQDTCDEIRDAVDQAKELKAKVVAKLRDPKTEVDWQEVAKVISFLIKIAMKFA